jgi:hypothetical protein
MTSDTRPIIIGGFYRCGTTLLRRLLDAHSCIQCPPEIKFFRDLRLEFQDDPYAHLRFFTTLRSLPAEVEDILDTVGQGYISLRRRIASRQGKSIWADKDPENALYLGGWQRLLPQGFRYIHMSRHPADMLLSALEASFTKTLPTQPDAILQRWHACCRAARQFQQEAPRDFSLLRYEDLVAHPQQTLQELFTWLELAYEPRVLSDFTHEQRGAGIEDQKILATRCIHSSSIGRAAGRQGREDFDRCLLPYRDELQWLGYPLPATTSHA